MRRRSSAPAPSFRLLTKRPVDRRRGGSRAQSARPLRQAARRRAHRRAGARRRGGRSAAAPAGACRRAEGALSHAPRSTSSSSARSCWRPPPSTRSSSIPRCRPSASPSCATNCAASATRSRRCAPNGPSSTRRRASRGWPTRHLALAAGQADAIRQLRSICPTPPAGAAGRAATPIGAMLAPPQPDDRPAACRRPQHAVTAHDARLPKRPESRWQRTLRSLLYGRNVDRDVKAKARLGLAIVAFAGIYGVIALRLVMFAVASDEPRRPSHRRPGRGRHRAARHPRPQRRDPRDRRQDAVAVRRAAQAHRRRRGRGAAHRRRCPTSTPRKCASAWPRSAASSGSSARSRRKQQQRDPPARHSRHRLPHREQARLSQRRRRSRTSSASSISTTRASPASRNGSTGRGSPRCTWRASPPTGCSGRCSSSLDLRVQHALRDELVKAREKFKAKAAAGLVAQRRYRRGRRAWCRCRTTTRTIRARPTIRAASTG